MKRFANTQRAYNKHKNDMEIVYFIIILLMVGYAIYLVQPYWIFILTMAIVYTLYTQITMIF